MEDREHRLKSTAKLKEGKAPGPRALGSLADHKTTLCTMNITHTCVQPKSNCAECRHSLHTKPEIMACCPKQHPPVSKTTQKLSRIDKRTSMNEKLSQCSSKEASRNTAPTSRRGLPHLTNVVSCPSGSNGTAHAVHDGTCSCIFSPHTYQNTLTRIEIKNYFSAFRSALFLSQ